MMFPATLVRLCDGLKMLLDVPNALNVFTCFIFNCVAIKYPENNGNIISHFTFVEENYENFGEQTSFNSKRALLAMRQTVCS